MFSPAGKKKILIQQKFGLNPAASSRSPRSSPSPQPAIDRKSSASSESPKRRRDGSNDRAATVAGTSRLENALSDPGALGFTMKKLLEATSHYRPERDSIALKAFEFTNLEYPLFRTCIQTTFWLSFADEEFQAFAEYFDPSSSGSVDGYNFLKAFTRLNAIRKHRESLELREKQESFLAKQKEIEDERLAELEKKNDLKVDYNFTAEIRDIAMRKLEAAAKAFDPGHPSAPSTAAFLVHSVAASQFREMLKLTFNLKLAPHELGAVLKEFREDIADEVPASEFLRFFLRLGIEAREQDKLQQRKRQDYLDKQAAEEAAKKKEESALKLKTFVDYNYSEVDEAAALQKLLLAAEKYDRTSPGSVALDGFECEELSPLDFRELLRRVFNISFTATELGFIIQKYDHKKTGNVLCKPFITDFLRSGNEARHKQRIDSLKRQRKLIKAAEEESVAKTLAVQKSEHVPYSKTFTDSHLQSALDKLKGVAVFYDKERGVSLTSFECQSLDLVQFKRALKRTFNLQFTAPEMGALVDHFDRNEKGDILCQPFLTEFISLGVKERSRLRTEQLEKQKELEKKALEEAELKRKANESKKLYDVDYDYEQAHQDSAMLKMIEAATKFDATHPASPSLQSFEKKFMTGPEFKEIVRRTFHLQLTPKEIGGIFGYFKERPGHTSSHKQQRFDQIDCGEFIKYFLQLGIARRAEFHSKQLEKQRREDKEREEEHRMKVEAMSNRGNYEPDMNFLESDTITIQDKLLVAAEKFDKNHPSAPSLEAFEAANMPPGVFRENIKAAFGVRASPKEIGYLLTIYGSGSGKNMLINTKEFLIAFTAMGQKARDDKRFKALQQQKDTFKQSKIDEQAKLTQLIEKADFQADMTFSTDDFREAVRRMTVASEHYDKTNLVAPNLDGFAGGPLSAGAFRELMKRAFSVYLNAKEVGSMLSNFPSDADPSLLDGKSFLIFFLRLGFAARAKRQTLNLALQRKRESYRKQEEERKLRMALARVDYELPKTYTDTDHESAMNKIRAAAMHYDRNAPGAPSMESFSALYLVPAVFKEILRRTFNISLSPAEVVAMVHEYNYSNDNIDTNKFLVSFIKFGFEERDKAKAVELEKQRRSEQIRLMAEEKQRKEAESKFALKVTYGYAPSQRDAAFAKLAAAAKRYDKSHPAAMSLEGFEQKSMKPETFREMLKRTFGLVPSAEELGALVHYFDQEGKGEIHSYNFLTFFLKLGINEREKDHKESMKKLREDAVYREKFHQQQMAAQWAKAELNVTFDFTEDDRASAIEKLTVAAAKFDPANGELTAFQASVLSPAVFREMLRRCFNLRLTNGELAALIKRFECGDAMHNVSCSEFIVAFNQLGFERRSMIRKQQLEKQRSMTGAALSRKQELQRQADAKADLDLSQAQFGDEDFKSVMEKIRSLASHYDRSHASAPSLKGFYGADMTPKEFKFMMMRTFSTALNANELAAIAATFPAAQADKQQAPDDNNSNSSINHHDNKKEIRISNRDFLAHFNKIQRDEQAKRDTERIARERRVMAKHAVHEAELVAKEKEKLLQRLQFSNQDEQSCAAKVKHIVREYTVDSSPYQDGMQGFKGAALPPDKLRDLLYNIFGVKLTFPEVGVLLSIMDDDAGLGVFDGPKFIKWFYRLSRLEEKAMLAEVTLKTRASAATLDQQQVVEPTAAEAVVLAGVTLDVMRSLGSNNATTAVPPPRTSQTARAGTAQSGKSSSAITRTAVLMDTSRSRSGSPTAMTTIPPPSGSDGKRSRQRQRHHGSDRKEKKGLAIMGYDASDELAFEESMDDNSAFTLRTVNKQKWFLPALSGGAVLQQQQDSNSYYQPQRVSSSQVMQEHLQGIFSTSSLAQGSASGIFSSSSVAVDGDEQAIKTSSIDDNGSLLAKSVDLGQLARQSSAIKVGKHATSTRRHHQPSNLIIAAPSITSLSKHQVESVVAESKVDESNNNNGSSNNNRYLTSLFQQSQSLTLPVASSATNNNSNDPMRRLNPIAQLQRLKQQAKKEKEQQRYQPPLKSAAQLHRSKSLPSTLASNTLASPTRKQLLGEGENEDNEFHIKAGAFFFPIVLPNISQPTQQTLYANSTITEPSSTVSPDLTSSTAAVDGQHFANVDKKEETNDESSHDGNAAPPIMSIQQEQKKNEFLASLYSVAPPAMMPSSSQQQSMFFVPIQSLVSIKSSNEDRRKGMKQKNKKQHVVNASGDDTGSFDGANDSASERFSFLESLISR